MVAFAYGEDHGGSSATRLTVDDLKYLFMVQTTELYALPVAYILVMEIVANVS